MAYMGSADVWEAGGYRFKEPFTVRLELEDGASLAYLDELDMWMDGFDDMDALEDLCDALAMLIADLRSAGDANLGPRPLRWKRIVEAALVRSGD